MSETFFIAQYDTLEPLEDILKDSLGNVIDLTLAQGVRLHVATGTPDRPVLYFDKPANIVGPGTNGHVKYGDPWDVADTSRSGTFLREWLIVWGPGVYQRVPSNFDDKIKIKPALAPNPP